jgi:6-phosphogluconolactonase
VPSHIEIAPAGDAFTEAAVHRIETLAAECVRERGRFVLSLAGGNTPKAIYRRWGETSRLDWSKAVLLYGDERCVPPHHPDSNHGMVEASLLTQLAERPTVYRMAGEEPEPERAARAYEETLRTELGAEGAIDLALLGIGADGHTASLFPGAAVLGERERLCVTTPAPDGKVQRLTLTVPVLKKARRILFLAAGGDKAEMLQKLMKGPVNETACPAQFFIRDEALDVTLMLDEPAAAEL